VKSIPKYVLSIRRKLYISYRLLEVEVMENYATTSVNEKGTSIFVDRDQNVPIRTECNDFYIFPVFERECERLVAIWDIIGSVL